MSFRLGLSAGAITLDLSVTLGGGFVPELARDIAACSMSSRYLYLFFASTGSAPNFFDALFHKILILGSPCDSPDWIKAW